MRRILVTGANKGIGLAIAKAILSAHDDTFVYLASRDAARGKAAADALPQWASRIDVLALDVANDRSVADAATRVKGLFGIVNNAGIGSGDLAAVLETNVVGIHRVCDAFLPLLEKDGRIVNVTSASGPQFVAKCSPERQRFFLSSDMTWQRLRSFLDECIAMGNDGAAFAAKGLGAGEPYGLSKACANVYTLGLARMHPHLRINACTPGFIETDMTRRYATAQNKSAAELGMKPPSEGAKAPMHLLFGALEGNGRYYGSDALRSPLDRYRSPGSPPYTGD